MRYLSFFMPVFLLFACGKKQEDQAPEPQLAAQPVNISKVVGVARIEPADGIIDLTANNTGTVQSVLVRENDEIKNGQVIAYLDTRIEKAQLDQAASKIGTQEAAISVSEAELHNKQADLDKARVDLERNQKLYDIKACTQQTLENSRAEVEKLANDLKRLQLSYQQTKAKLNESQADVQYYQTVLATKPLFAPSNGKILDLDLHAGDNVATGNKIGEFAPTGNVIAVTEVDELFADRIRLGQRAVITSQGDGHEIAAGKVVFAASYLKKKSLFADENNTEDRRVRTVHVQLDTNAGVLFGARVDCTILLEN